MTFDLRVVRLTSLDLRTVLQLGCQQRQAQLLELGMNVTLRQLEIFAAVSSTGSVTDAAKELGLTQPAVSTTLGQLELTIGHASTIG
jgi:DNA-binding MarR family transcriptional regulator